MSNKNIIFCFSATGNSLFIAQEIAKTIKDCNIINMPNNTGIPLEQEYDSVGFIYPTFFGGLPKVVSQFIDELAILNKPKYTYVIATYAGIAANGALQANKQLSEKELQVDYVSTIKMQSSYILHEVFSRNSISNALKSSKELQPILQDLLNNKKNSIKRMSMIANLYNNIRVSKVNKGDNNFIINDDCNGCGLCTKVCPVDNIIIKENKPVFNHQCEQCFACLHHCPQAAINYKKITIHKARYRHPYINISSIINLNNN